MSDRSRSKKSLSEQILALSTPKPASFHPDQDFLEDATAAKLCDFSYEQESEANLSSQLNSGRHRSRRSGGGALEEDPKYAGRVVSRKELQDAESSTADEGEEGWSCGRGIEVVDWWV